MLLNTGILKSKHPEADTGVFSALKCFAEAYGSTCGSSIIIDCPETDCITILLYQFTAIQSLLNQHGLKLFCRMHDQ